MHNITYRDFSWLAQEHLDANLNIRHELLSHLSERLERDTDLRIMDILEKRLGRRAEPEKLAGRLQRVITRGTGYETLVLDGRPFARVYEAIVTTEGLTTTAKRVIEELEG